MKRVGVLVLAVALAMVPKLAMADTSPIGAPSEVSLPRYSPVQTPVPGNWGMTFLFGGLAPLSVGGVATIKPNPMGNPNFMFSEIGFRAVLSQVVIPFSLGLGVSSNNPDKGDSTVDFGVSASVGVLKGFRMWRRISPYFGGMLHISYVDPTGPSNYAVTFALGPVLGIEYFIADRVSLFAQAELDVALTIQDATTIVNFGTFLAGGGQLGLTFYF